MSNLLMCLLFHLPVANKKNRSEDVYNFYAVQWHKPHVIVVVTCYDVMLVLNNKKKEKRIKTVMYKFKSILLHLIFTFSKI